MKTCRICLILLSSLSALVACRILAVGGDIRPVAHSQHTEGSGEVILASTPPMGWNSYDSYGGDVNEEEVRANAKYLAEHLAHHGWKYVVIDYYWYFSHSLRRGEQAATWDVAMDDYGRLLPAINHFPSAANGRGFKPIADYVHSLGLKFGIHIMRGIPRAAVRQNLPILGTQAHAQDVADTSSVCDWSTAMYGVDTSKPAGRAYYDSLVKLYAEWGVDYIKADDMSWEVTKTGETYHAAEIEALRTSMNKAGRPMVLSLSPGPTEIQNAEHVARWAQLWRMSDDFWDKWEQVEQQFDLCRLWAPHIGPGHWPDADMLPLGRLRLRFFGDGPRVSLLTRDEQVTLLTLWAIFRSPLMMGGDLLSTDPSTLSLLMNDEVIAVDQVSSGNRELFSRDKRVAWTADIPGKPGKYVALFNLRSDPTEVGVSWKELGLPARCTVRDLWQQKDLGSHRGGFATTLPRHGAFLLKVVPLLK